VKETGATGELQIPDPRVTAALHGYQLIPVSLESFLRADHLELLLLLLLLHSKTKLRTWLHHAVFSQSWSVLHQITDKQIRLLLLLVLFLVSLGAYKLSYGCKICMHTEKEMDGCVGIASLASRTRFLDPNSGAMSHGVAMIKFKSSCNLSWSR
jgi:hypothetical protein